MELVTLQTAALIPYAKNAKLHSEQQVALIAGSIRAFGFNNPVLVDGENVIIAGHGRVLAAFKLGLAEVPCIRITHLSDNDRRAYMLADNRLQEVGGGWDMNMLAMEIETLTAASFDLGEIGFDEVFLKGMGAPTEEGNADAEPRMDKAAELNAKRGVKVGDLWLIGEHRLLCGDSTKADGVKRLLGDDVPRLMVTDPPYGVEYDANWRNDQVMAGKGARVPGGRAVGKVENDDRADWREAWALFPGDVAYVWHASLHSHEVMASLLTVEFSARAMIIWAKNHICISRGHYHWKHEPCWYAVRDGRTANWIGDRKQNTVWEIDKPQASETGHSTQKPVECMARPMRNHESEFVYDPFMGSGTTMVAAQNLGRKCLGVELNPGYVAVILDRMATAFPELEIRRAT